MSARDDVSKLAEALTALTATEERWWEAEVYRLKGALLLQRPNPDVGQAEACFQQALDVARRQQAKALELRAALSGRILERNPILYQNQAGIRELEQFLTVAVREAGS